MSGSGCCLYTYVRAISKLMVGSEKKLMVGSEKKDLQRVPAFQLVLTDEQLRAVGHVTLQWAFLEWEIDRELDWLNEVVDTGVNLRLPFGQRATRWIEMAEVAYEAHPQLYEAVRSISERAQAIKRERDRFAHGSLGSSGIFLRIRDGQIIDISDAGTAADIEDLACRISDINAALSRHQSNLEKLLEAPV